MRHLRFTVLAVVALTLCAAPVAAEARPHKAALPVHSLGGLSGSELFGEGWAHVLANPSGAFAGSCYSLGRNGKVLVPEADENLTASCTTKPGTPVYLFFGSECSNVEEPPFFGADAEAQRECVIAFDQEFFVAATVTVDDGQSVDILNPRFEVVSPQRTVQLPPDNILGVPPQAATFVAHGWAAVVRGLTPGEHTITIVVEDVDGFVTTFVGTINVVPGGRF